MKINNESNTHTLYNGHLIMNVRANTVKPCLVSQGLAFFLKQLSLNGKIKDPKPSCFFNRMHHRD